MTDFAAARTAMVDTQVRPSDVTRFPLIGAMLAVPREDFVPAGLRQVAYFGEHLPLGGGRVVLDPRVFAKMLDALDIGPGDRVLDVGCAYGYSAAVIARLAGAVVALEEDADLAREAAARLAAEGARNVVVRNGALAAAAPEAEPFDAIMVEGAVEVVPEAFTEQLAPGGRIAAIFAEGPGGQARLGVRTAQGIGWRRIFDATAPVLPGFARTKAFEF